MARKKRNCWDGKWPGGRIWRDAEGRPVYVIRKQRRGKPYELSTHCHDHDAAMEHFARWEADPDAYDPRGSEQKDPVYLDLPLIEAFLRWSGLPKAQGGKGNTPEWVGNQKAHLAFWAGRLRAIDLRAVSVPRDVLAPLEGAPSRAQRIAVLKTLYAYLRTVRHLISAAEDPTLDVLRVPQSDPEQWRRPKDVPPAVFEGVVAKLAETRVETDKRGRRIEKSGRRWRDVLLVLGGTGWHVTEARRFAAGGRLERLGDEAVLFCPRTKGGEPERTRVSGRVAEAAARLRDEGSFSVSEFYRAVKAACVAANVDPFAPGQMRHAVATWAINNGADPAAVAAYLNHKSPRTTRRFYATHASPSKVPTLV